MISPYFSFVQQLLSLELIHHFYRNYKILFQDRAKPTHVKENAHYLMAW